MPSNLTVEERDKMLVDLVRFNTDLQESDIQTLLEISHSLPFVSNLEGGDTYINVLIKTGQSMVIAQYRHPDCDLYKRDIIGEIEEKADEPAVYRALEYGLSGRGLIGVIDEGRTIVRHTVSPIRNHDQKVIGALTYEYPNSHESDTEPVRIRNSKDGKSTYLDDKIDKITGYLQDGILLFDESCICTFANTKAIELYRGIGYKGNLTGQKYEDLQLIQCSLSDVIMKQNVIKGEVRLGEYILEERVSAIWEDGIYKGITVVLQDKTQIRQMEDEITYRITSVNEVHHRVKNNLQTIISVVGLEAAQTKNEEVKAFAKTIISRICSISVTHDLLAHTGTDGVNLKTMLIRVIDSGLESCNASGCKVHAEIKGDDLELAASEASTVALVINELVQNSLKYAFRNCEEGTIWMTIGKGEEYSWITVRDNGCGFDEKAEKKIGSGLGLKLVDNLVRSNLKGSVSVSSSDQGTTTRFSFRNMIKI